MGGDVLFALNIAAFPDDLPPQILSEIFAGGADKVAEAGAVIAGGHTVTDEEPKYGLVATGTIDPNRIWTKSSARTGDHLYLTKPLGTGIITTAHKRDAVKDDQLNAAVVHMSTLNLAASKAAQKVSVRACTDITGFGLLGHAWEMATKSGVRILVRASSVPVLDGALDLARAGHIAGGLGRNRAYYTAEVAAPVEIDPAVDLALSDVLFDPQTSGGLLFAISESITADFEAALTEANILFWHVGTVHEGAGVGVVP
jgi:selenide,water dikinase